MVVKKLLTLEVDTNSRLDSIIKSALNGEHITVKQIVDIPRREVVMMIDWDDVRKSITDEDDDLINKIVDSGDQYAVLAYLLQHVNDQVTHALEEDFNA